MQISLHIGASVDAAWESVVLPWFESVSADALLDEHEIAVVTPVRGEAYFLRARILDRGISLLGVKFLSPAQLREILLHTSDLILPPREHLRLLLAMTADESAAESTADKIDNQSPEILIAKSVARDPDHFLRAIDQINIAGWNFDEIEPRALREIAARFEKRVRACGFSFVHEADRAASAQAQAFSPRFSHFLVTGFNGAHWPLWPLLRAAVTSSTEATIILNDPRDEARDLDEVWVGTWEESFGAAEPIAGASERSTSSLGELLANTASQTEAATGQIHFLIGRDATEQARAIVALTAKFLCQKNCERIGILFPRRGALPRLVASFLESAQIAHNDGIGHLAPSVFDDDAWRAWLELQANPRLKFLFRFLRATDAEIFDGMSIFDVEETLRRAYADVLLDKIDILREYCARSLKSDETSAIVRGLDTIQFLPAAATLTEFLAQTQKIFSHLGWRQHGSELERLSRTWSREASGPVSKTIYLRWLGEVLGASSLRRDEHGSHPYSRVHLLPCADAENQSWSHLIFAGSNEEAWPSLDEEFGFIGSDEIDEFNRQNKILNRRAVRRGRQGEGQWSVRADKTLLLGASERRQLRRRQLMNLVESVTADIGVAANLYSGSFPSRISNPSDLFSRLYFAARGSGLSHETLHALEEETRSWLKDWSPLDAQKIDSISLGRTRYAYDARRQSRAAGEYEFALRLAPDRPISLRVTEWEQALKWPALVWMKLFLGVETEDETGDAWAIATGQWVHRWLAEAVQDSSANGFVPLRSTDEIRVRILEEARHFRSEIQSLGAHSLPDWWTSGWSNALYLADCLATKLCDLGDWSQMAAEFSLGSPAIIPLSSDEALRVRGRIDLILARGPRKQSPIGYSDLWVIDYKTGRQRGFNLRELRRHASPEEKMRKQLVDGRGVQLALYALAVNALGASQVRLTLLAPVGELEPQFSLEHALAQKDIWRELHRMQESGAFGMLGKVHADYGAIRAYPLATLAVDPDLLRKKWGLTHPALAQEEEEEGEI
jgi:hypothetical protein